MAISKDYRLKEGGGEKAYVGFDVEGLVPLFTNLGDMIVLPTVFTTERLPIRPAKSNSPAASVFEIVINESIFRGKSLKWARRFWPTAYRISINIQKATLASASIGGAGGDGRIHYHCKSQHRKSYQIQ